MSRAQCHILRHIGFDPDALTDPLDDGLPDRNGKPTKPSIGFLMADAYAGYNGACGPGKYARQACFAHGRRKFELYEEFDANAAAIMVTINDLYRIEREAKREAARLLLDKAGTDALYLAVRQAQSVPLLDKLKAQLSRPDVFSATRRLFFAVLVDPRAAIDNLVELAAQGEADWIATGARRRRPGRSFKRETKRPWGRWA